MTATKNTPDIAATHPFVMQLIAGYDSRPVIIPFTNVADTPGYTDLITGKPYKFFIDQYVESKRIKSISLMIRALNGSTDYDDLRGYTLGATNYNIPYYTQIADWYLTIKNKRGEILFDQMPLTRLTYITTTAFGKYMAMDLQDISLAESYVMKMGSAAANPTRPFVFAFQFFYEP